MARSAEKEVGIRRSEKRDKERQVCAGGRKRKRKKEEERSHSQTKREEKRRLQSRCLIQVEVELKTCKEPSTAEEPLMT